MCSFQAQFFCLIYKNNFLRLRRLPGRNTTDLLVIWGLTTCAILVAHIPFFPLGQGFKNSRIAAFFSLHTNSLVPNVSWEALTRHRTPSSLLTFTCFQNQRGHACTMLYLFTVRKKAVSSFDDLYEFTHVDMIGHKELGLSRTGSCFSPSCGFVITGIMLGCCMVRRSGRKVGAEGCAMVGQRCHGHCNKKES